MEKLVHQRISTYFDANNILSRYQYGFQSGRSMQQSVFELVKFIYSALNNKKITKAICLDVCKAFDCINHDVLMIKLKKMALLKIPYLGSKAT